MSLVGGTTIEVVQGEQQEEWPLETLKGFCVAQWGWENTQIYSNTSFNVQPIPIIL